MSQGVAVFRRIYAENNTILNSPLSFHLNRYAMMCMPGTTETMISVLEN